jgi:hypothetical protein
MHWLVEFWIKKDYSYSVMSQDWNLGLNSMQEIINVPKSILKKNWFKKAIMKPKERQETRSKQT